ncbi:MAG: hypothetical protein U1F77_16465 [Kiritimatiellia bacterium]
MPFPVTLTTSRPRGRLHPLHDRRQHALGDLRHALHRTRHDHRHHRAAFHRLPGGWESSTVDTHTYLVLEDVLTQSPTGGVPGRPGRPRTGAVASTGSSSTTAWTRTS